MGVYRVEVDVATARPPRPHATLYVDVEAVDGYDAELIACQLAACRPGVVMPVGSLVIDWPED